MTNMHSRLAALFTAASLAATISGCAENTHPTPGGGLTTLGYDQSGQQETPGMTGIRSEDAICPQPYLQGAPLQEGIIAHDAFFYAQVTPARTRSGGTAIQMNVTAYSSRPESESKSFSATVSAPNQITINSEAATQQQETRERQIASEFFRISQHVDCSDTSRAHFVLSSKHEGYFALRIPMKELPGRSSYLVARVVHNYENVSDVVYVDGWDASINQQVHATAYAPGPNITVDLYRNGRLIPWVEAKRNHPGLSGLIAAAIDNYLDYSRVARHARLETPEAPGLAQNDPCTVPRAATLG